MLVALDLVELGEALALLLRRFVLFERDIGGIDLVWIALVFLVGLGSGSLAGGG